jgi:hypothetical protein
MAHVGVSAHKIRSRSTAQGESSCRRWTFPQRSKIALFRWLNVGLEPLRWDGEVGIEARGKQGSGKTRGFVMPSLLTESVHPDAQSWPAPWRRWHAYGYEPLRILLDIKGSVDGGLKWRIFGGKRWT